MSKISTWSSTAASNNSTPPDGFPEGMNPSDVNNAAREVMAAVRTQHEDAQWIDLGNTPTFATTTTFTLVGDQTAQYDVGRRVKCTDASTLYGSITDSAFTSVTTVTVSLDSGVLSASLTAVALGILSGTNKSMPVSLAKFTSTDDITLAGVTGAAIFGGDGTGQHIALDPDEIMSKVTPLQQGHCEYRTKVVRLFLAIRLI